MIVEHDSIATKPTAVSKYRGRAEASTATFKPCDQKRHTAASPSGSARQPSRLGLMAPATDVDEAPNAEAPGDGDGGEWQLATNRQRATQSMLALRL